MKSSPLRRCSPQHFHAALLQELLEVDDRVDAVGGQHLQRALPLLGSEADALAAEAAHAEEAAHDETALELTLMAVSSTIAILGIAPLP